MVLARVVDMNKMLIPILLIFLFSPIALATDYCIDNQTLLSNITIEGQVITIEENCPHGCDDSLSICLLSPLYQTLIVIGIGVLILLFIFFINKVFK